MGVDSSATGGPKGVGTYRTGVSSSGVKRSFDILRSSDSADIYPYGFAFTSAELDGAVQYLSDILPELIQLAQLEKSCQLMAAEIEKTRRRVNALEYVMIPELQADIKYITMKLEENENSTKVRLMKVKEMVLQDAHHYEY